jgi:hypothetical protein
VRTLSSAELLAVWEQGAGMHPVDRGLLLLSEAFPDVPYASLADWPLGLRNRALAEWLCRSSGPHLAGRATCGQCGENLEFELDVRVFLETEPVDADARVEVGGRALRLPSSRALARAAYKDDPREAVMSLLEACSLGDGDPLSLAEEEVEELGEKFALADPLAETRITLSCPECEAEWGETLDVTAFAWAEAESRAKRLLLEVHLLATAYGWSEADVLSVGEHRRAFYLEAAGR